MKAKIEGEDEVRMLYASEDVKRKKLSYTIIRPGGLTGEGLPPYPLDILNLNNHPAWWSYR
jgi:hypothetical protein